MLSSTVPADRTDPRTLHLRLAADADPAVLAELVDHYRGYATALARRLHRRGLPLEDLEQVALEALVKALQRFDPGRGVPFPAYATPTVIGAIKRHYRDSGWMVRVPRGVHELVRGRPDDRRPAHR
jgi:RNA polymerase sigma-B factor